MNAAAKIQFREREREQKTYRGGGRAEDSASSKSVPEGLGT